MPKLIAFNGPPGTGKDTAVDITFKYLRKHNFFGKKFSIAEPIKKAVHNFYGIKYRPATIEAIKDKPLEELCYSTLREEYIVFAEMFVKAMHGLNYFGNMAVERMKTIEKKTPVEDRIYLVSDAGFDEEIKPIVEYLGEENCLFYKLVRQGKDWKNDSRGYLKDVPLETVLNAGSKASFELEIQRRIRKDFLGGILEL